MGTDIYVDLEDPKRVSDKSDVYSYGVVLLELITGRKPKYQDIDIVNWAKSRIKQALEEEYRGFVDTRLQSFDKIEMKRMVYCAEACVYSRPQLRPSMEKIVLALKGHMPNLKDLHGSTENDTELPHITINKGISSSSTERFQRIFTYQELTIATEGFSGKNLVARSSQCQVYKGYLNGETVTVKKYNYMPGKKEDVFDHIKSISSSVHHNNLVNLLGFCNEGPNRLLVYEFVSEDKSLRSHLHGNVTSTLAWPIRMGIALSIARGMVDLHELYKPLNIYEQYKDDSIFLDGNFQPKFAEYGHGRFLSGAFGGHSLTVNYAKADVYLFGEILMELVTGKPSNEDGVNIAEWAEPVLGMALLHKEYDIVDQKLKEFNATELIRMIKCALACVHRYAHFRPQMSQIAEVLAGNAPPETLK
ncbi:proline-rich receptor-like protein kinase PERK3 isoform X1 [Manihot esculenta]|uniref:proline-rich receptor-like protein kinase PERK3 isoform X1 n=1 Tax=Manihot esculenta TaxID=3983 RepID=UPI000B5D6B61|nr:proline-rich receptor-like protein kinase PERK3 isoform X1 [Manihot esculenta]